MQGIGIAGKSAIFNQLGICGAHKLENTSQRLPRCLSVLYTLKITSRQFHTECGVTVFEVETLPKRSKNKYSRAHVTSWSLLNEKKTHMAPVITWINRLTIPSAPSRYNPIHHTHTHTHTLSVFTTVILAYLHLVKCEEKCNEMSCWENNIMLTVSNSRKAMVVFNGNLCISKGRCWNLERQNFNLTCKDVLLLWVWVSHGTIISYLSSCLQALPQHAVLYQPHTTNSPGPHSRCRSRRCSLLTNWGDE